jgi:16S rRNA (adenine1518-N6/adenine1519-N6)-dimethyltransferase
MHNKQELDRRLKLANVQPLKKLGQNFLLNPKICGRVIEAVVASHPNTVVEIGPGLGGLTDELIALGNSFELKLIEIDSGLVKYWREFYPNVEMIHQDALQIDWNEFQLNGTGVIVSNLPYSIAASLVVELSTSCNLNFKHLYLMFQKEVAERITAKKGGADYGMLSVIAQRSWNISNLVDAGPQDFFPVPNVGSRVLKFDLKDQGGRDRKGFLDFVKASFSQRRKKLSSNLSSRYKKENILEGFEKMGLSDNTRAQELEPEMFEKLFSLIKILLFFTLIFHADEKAFAGALNLYGYGAQNTSLGNATVALPTDAFSQNYNPALMSLQKAPLFTLGIDGAITKFNGISQVVVDTPSLGGTQVQTGDVSTITSDTFLATLAFQTPLSLKKKDPLHIGFYLISPVEKIASINSQDSFQPEYALYLNDTEKFMIGTNLSLKLWDFLSLGLGGELYFAQGASATSRLPAQGNSTARLAIDEKPLVAPVAGLAIELNPFWTLGLSFHGREDYTSNISIQDNISIVGPTPINFTATSSLFFDPDTYRVGAGYSDGKSVLGLSADYQRWVGFNGTVIALHYSTFTQTFGQTLPPTPYHDVINLHAGAEHTFDRVSLRCGYSFLPTPVPDQSGESNILDSDKHVIALGGGYAFRSDFLDASMKLDLVGFVQMLQSKTVVKNSSQSIGYPGYTIGGNVYGYSLSLTTEF